MKLEYIKVDLRNAYEWHDREAFEQALGRLVDVEDYETVLADHRRLVRELDKLLNGPAAAKQASLVDLVVQLTRARGTVIKIHLEE